MKICILTHDFPPGQGAALLYIDSLVKELLKLGVEIVVVTVSSDSRLPEFEKNGNLTVYRFFTKWHRILSNFEYMFRLKPFLDVVYRNEKFDLIHSEHIFPVPAAGSFSSAHKIPHIAVIEGISKVSLYSKFVYLAHRFFLPRAHFDVLVSWSRFMVGEYFDKWGIDRRKIVIIPGGIDIKKFNPYVDGRKERKKLGYSGIIILTAKPLYKTNAFGIAYIIRAMKYVSEKYSKCKLIIIGTGRSRKELEDLTKKLGLQDKVEFFGWVNQDEIPKYYRAADIVVNSIAYRHAGSVTVLESLASGTPMVLTRSECLPGKKCLPTNDIAVLVKPADSADIARGILDLLGNKKLGTKIGNNAWKFVSTNFSMEKIAKDYKRLYERLLM